jgi:uncharacterized protein (TIGR03000 family)
MLTSQVGRERVVPALGTQYAARGPKATPTDQFFPLSLERSAVMSFRIALALVMGTLLFAELGAGRASAQFAPTARPGYMPNPFNYQRGLYNRLAPRWPYPVRPYTPYATPYAVPYAVPVPVPVPVAGSVSGGGGSIAPDSTAPAMPMGTASIRITLPVEGAKININGTDFGTGTGYDRNLSVPSPLDGHGHDYKVTATWTKDGKEINETRTVTVKSNAKALANFLIPGK